MLKRTLVASMLGTALVALPGAVLSQGKSVTHTAGSGQILSESSLVARYTGLAGSANNARAMVEGLRRGTPFTLVAVGTTTTSCTPMGCTTTPGGEVPTGVTPPTGNMGWGNVDIALALTEARLGGQGNPAHAALKTALMEILDLRAAGSGWGEIAAAMDLKLVEAKGK